MGFQAIIEGNSPVIMHGVTRGIDFASEANREKAAIVSRRGGDTGSEEARLRELETLASPWHNNNGGSAIPERARRTILEARARTRRQGPQVRQT